jgi:cell wall-associated NlpC family hydrolase
VRWAAGLGAVTAGLVALPVLATALVFAPPPSTGARAASGGGTTRLAWAEAFSSRIGAASPDAVRFALAWVTEEGAPADDNNPLDASLPEPGSTPLPGNPDGVRVYPDSATGLQAAVDTLTQADPGFGYQAVLDALRRSDLAAAAEALQRSRWCADPGRPSGQCPGYGAAILQLAESYRDGARSTLAGQVGAGTTSLPADEANRPVPGTGEAGGGIRALLAWLHLQLGKPYLWGGAGPDGFDCSGLAMMAYAQVGVALPRTAAEQYAATADVALPLSEAQPGDLLFWAYRPADPATIHHVAIYVGAGRIIEAASEGVPVHDVPVWDDGGLLPVVTRPP